ncbi:SDR family NAD(P)-dependent oxidoreductase [Parendozoicomonas sp. Alg238-R29]|uniref:SDR family NAD(P)-dependent oxidoreductase n=1 Tax=Parendozoicomonas sp. Alg238-R29 TaxID=2993446 RepID=UPI00248E54E3|nr:SDR family NAD(P)-dependent oxidoreductase [Parendozoicomonas sp. Alg238-R29]
MRSLEGKVVAITGAGSGIGQHLAIELARQGCLLSLAEINPSSMKLTCEMLPENCQYQTSTTDVSKKEQVDKFAESTIEKFGHVDVLINNAGVALSQTISDMDIEEMEWLMNINFWGVVYGCKAFLPHLLKQKEAHIVNTSSVFGLMAVPTQGAYNASKFAVRGFTEALSQEMKHTGINVSCVYPGGIKTNIVKHGRYHIGPDNNEDQDIAASNFEQMATTTPQRAAQVMINGILNNRKRIMIGSDSLLIDWLVRLLPTSYEKILSKGLHR